MTGGSLTMHVHLAGRRCLVDLLLRAPFDADLAARLAASWLDGGRRLTLLDRA